MSTKAFPRIYKNNSMYAEDKLPYIDALALTVQKFFYTKRNAVYYLAGTIELWDFMTLTRYYIAASTSEFGQSDIETYISAMDDPSAQMFGGKAVEYTKDRDHIILYGTPAMVLSLMWAAWIYAKMRLSVAGDDKKPLWQRAAELLYNSMKDFYDDPDHKCFGESNRLLSIADDAVNTMGTYAAEKIRKSKNIQAQQPVPAKEHPVPANNDSAQLESRIAELEAENKELKEQIELLQSPEGAPIDTEGHGAVRLELLRQLMDKAGAQWQKRGNKVIAAQLMAAITGLAPKTCKNHLSDPHVNQTEHQETILDFNSKLKALGIEITL